MCKDKGGDDIPSKAIQILIVPCRAVVSEDAWLANGTVRVVTDALRIPPKTKTIAI